MIVARLTEYILRMFRFDLIDEMRRTPNLIYNTSSASGGQEEEVYTDSCYYFDPHTAALMANVRSTSSDATSSKVSASSQVLCTHK